MGLRLSLGAPLLWGPARLTSRGKAIGPRAKPRFGELPPPPPLKFQEDLLLWSVAEGFPRGNRTLSWTSSNALKVTPLIFAYPKGSALDRRPMAQDGILMQTYVH